MKPTVTIKRAKPASRTKSSVSAEPPVGKRKTTPKEVAAAPAPSNKQQTIISMLRRSQGATVAELSTATDWQLHSVRGALSGVIKKKLGLQISSEKIVGRGRAYRIA